MEKWPAGQYLSVVIVSWLSCKHQQWLPKPMPPLASKVIQAKHCSRWFRLFDPRRLRELWESERWADAGLLTLSQVVPMRNIKQCIALLLALLTFPRFPLSTPSQIDARGYWYISFSVPVAGINTCQKTPVLISPILLAHDVERTLSALHHCHLLYFLAVSSALCFLSSCSHSSAFNSLNSR